MKFDQSILTEYENNFRIFEDLDQDLTVKKFIENYLLESIKYKFSPQCTIDNIRLFVKSKFKTKELKNSDLLNKMVTPKQILKVKLLNVIQLNICGKQTFYIPFSKD